MMKTIKELEAERPKEFSHYGGYTQALKDVLKLIDKYRTANGDIPTEKVEELKAGIEG